MTDQAWTNQVVDILDHISDRDFQLRAWTGAGPEVSSFTEILSQLFNDQDFQHFTVDIEDEFARKICEDLILTIEKLDYSLERMEPRELIDNSEWNKVRLLAESASKAVRSSLVDST